MYLRVGFGLGQKGNRETWPPQRLAQKRQSDLTVESNDEILFSSIQLASCHHFAECLCYLHHPAHRFRILSQKPLEIERGPFHFSDCSLQLFYAPIGAK